MDTTLSDDTKSNHIIVFKFDEAGKILRLEAYRRRGAKKPTAEQAERVVKAYAEARSNGLLDGCESQTSLFGRNSCFTIEDPIGASAETNEAELRAFLISLEKATLRFS